MPKKKTLGFQTTEKQFPTEAPVLLPQSPEEFDAFVEDLIKKFSLPDNVQTRCSIAELICHLPKDRAYVEHVYIANGVRRGIAHIVAFNKLEALYGPIREAQKQKEAEEKAQKEQAKLTVVPNGADTPDESQPVQGA